MSAAANHEPQQSQQPQPGDVVYRHTTSHYLEPQRLYRALDVRRTAMGITWQVLSSRTGVSLSTISRLRDGATPRTDSFISLVCWTGIPLSEVVRHTRPRPVEQRRNV